MTVDQNDRYVQAVIRVYKQCIIHGIPEARIVKPFSPDNKTPDRISFYSFYNARIVIGLALCLLTLSVSAYESAPQINISEIVSPELAQSISHRVEDARLSGNSITFRVESEFGEFNVESLLLLITRVREILILTQAVNEMNRTNRRPAEYSRGKYSVSADSALDILSRPMSTASNVAEQVRSNIENDPVNVPEKYHLYTDEGNIEKEDPVIAMHKRNIASQWGLDVYSTNPYVQMFLKDAAMARSAGKISAGAPPILNRRVMPMMIENKNLEFEISLLLKNRSISELEELNRRLLTGMNIDSQLISTFLNHNIYSPGHKTVITQYMNILNNVADRSAFFKLAVKADNEISALGYEVLAKMLGNYHEHISPLLKIYSANDILQAITRDNRMLFLTTADLIYWTEETERKYTSLARQSESAGFRNRELITSGVLTKEASMQMKTRGFDIREKFVF